MSQKRNFRILCFFSTVYLLSCSYDKVYRLIEGNKCDDALNVLESMNKKSKECSYLRAIISHKVMVENILCDNVASLVVDTIQEYSDVFNFNDTEYSLMAYNKIVDIYNFFLERVHLCEENMFNERCFIDKECLLLAANTYEAICKS